MRNLFIWIIIMATCAYLGSKWYLHNEVSQGMDTAVLMMSPYANVEYEGVASTLTGELTIEGIRIRIDGFNDDLYIDSLGIDTPSFLSLIELGDVAKMQSDGLPEHFGFIMEGLRVPADADYYSKLYAFTLEARGITDADEAAAECTGKYGFSPAALAGLGYTEQVISSSITFNNQRGKYSLDLTVSMDDMWDMDVSLTLAGDMLSEMSRGLASRPRLSSLEVEMTDRSLNKRVTEYCSQRGLSEKEIVQAKLDSFKFAGEENGIEFDEYVLEPYVDYIGGKSTLVVTARPNEPVAMSQIHLYKPSDVPALLNLEATAL
ncbi:MAG: hypothetical protein QNK16_11100 [Woeseiaceae bacterium]|nr:hypothetical protein [Woeseiaceae bacterium]MDX2608922.1 hypothetical protein [Woeseiaceae bacterium]